MQTWRAARLLRLQQTPLSGPLQLEAQRAAGWDVTASMAPDAPDAARRAIVRAVSAQVMASRLGNCAESCFDCC